MPEDRNTILGARKIADKFDFSYYKPINDKQAAFHQSTSRHKLIMGGVGAGKTYPGIHESLMTCADNPGCEFAVFRNTWDSLADNVQKDFLKVSEMANCHAPGSFEKTARNLHLYNNVIVRFRPLSISTEQIKGMNLCGYLIDDPNVWKYRGPLGFLYTRLRDNAFSHANYRQGITMANWEGRDFLWQVFMRGREPGGNGRFAYWVIRTDENPTLDPEFIEDLAAVHSQAWMDRYVFCNPEVAYSGLVYPEYDPTFHDKDLGWCSKNKELVKIMVIDNGVGITCVYKMATDFRKIYIYDEWYKRDVKIGALGEYLKNELRKDDYKAVLIDPSSAQTEQTSDSCVKNDLWKNYGIRCQTATNARTYGIEVVKNLLTVRDGETHMAVDPIRCPMWKREAEIYRWKEQRMGEFDEFVCKEEPVDKDDHGMDCTKYGGVYMKRYLRGIMGREMLVQKRREKMWDERRKKLKLYKEPRMRKNDPYIRNLKKIHAGARKKYPYGKTMINTLVHEQEMRDGTYH